MMEYPLALIPNSYNLMILAFAGMAVACSATLTLAKVVFGIVTSNFDEARDTDPQLRTIRTIVETAPFYEVVSLGRIVSNSTAAVLGAFYLVGRFHPTQVFLFDMIIWLLVIWHILYLFVIFIPSVIGNLRPYSLAFPTLLLYRAVSLFLIPPATLSRRFYDRFLARLGFDPKLRFLTEDQREMLESDTSEPEDESALEEDERQMIRNIFDFVETPVREIMTPRIDILALECGVSLDEVVKCLNNERHSRVPVYRENMDNIVGVLHNRDFLHWFTENRSEDFVLEKIAKPAMFVPYHKKIDDLLREFRRSGNQIAIVVDEYGGTAGLVSLEDILEEIVGDIRDEDDHDEEQPIVKLKDGRFLVDPTINIDDLEFELDLTLEVPEDAHVETLSGLIQATLGSIPSQGEQLTIGRCKIKVLRMSGTRMEKVLISLT